MTLDLTKSVIYAYPYPTNWDYLHNMTELQVKALNEMKWEERYGHKYIDTGLWVVPWTWIDEKNTKYSMNVFINDLNRELMRL
jgi:hypothetical protein